MTEARQSRSTLIGVLAAAVFIAGVAAGVIGDRLMTQRPSIKTRIVTDMGEVLDHLRLTGSQRTQAESILARRTPRSEGVMIELAERLHAVSDSVDAELRAILTPEQRSRLDSLKRREPTLMLKRRVIGPGGATVDTVFQGRRDSTTTR